MPQNGKTKGYYIPDDLRVWLEEQAAKEKRSVSNFLALLIEKAKANAVQ